VKLAIAQNSRVNPIRSETMRTALAGVCAAVCFWFTMHDARAADTLAPQRLFISGHSLVDQPFPAHLIAIAASQGAPLQWQRQYMTGSLLRGRTMGDPPPVWGGYRNGEDRDGGRIDVLAELRTPRSVSGGPYDALLVTEQHWVLHAVTSGDTARYLRHVHDRMLDNNAAARTFFFEPWISIDDLSAPQRWVDMERMASRVWGCVVTRRPRANAARRRSACGAGGCRAGQARNCRPVHR
jgi:hypothetical protein